MPPGKAGRLNCDSLKAAEYSGRLKAAMQQAGLIQSPDFGFLVSNMFVNYLFISANSENILRSAFISISIFRLKM